MISLPLRHHRRDIESAGAGGRLGTTQRPAKIVGTWGPAVAPEERLRAIMDADVYVFRLNFSHATHTELAEAVPRIRAIADPAGRQVALLQDVQGPRRRTRLLPDDARFDELPEGARRVTTTSHHWGSGAPARPEANLLSTRYASTRWAPTWACGGARRTRPF